MAHSSRPTVEVVLDFYEDVLASLKLKADHEGLISLDMGVLTSHLPSKS